MFLIHKRVVIISFEGAYIQLETAAWIFGLTIYILLSSCSSSFVLSFCNKYWFTVWTLSTCYTLLNIMGLCILPFRSAWVIQLLIGWNQIAGFVLWEACYNCTIFYRKKWIFLKCCLWRFNILKMMVLMDLCFPYLAFVGSPIFSDGIINGLEWKLHGQEEK